MLPAYPDAPRTVNNRGVLHSTHLESQLAKAQRRIAELTRDAMPKERETLEEERERWQEQKEHLLERVEELEALLNARESAPYTDEDKAGLAAITGGKS
jgi:TolA-binding protein